jgi:predicted HTH transcriptional regulator
MTDVDSRLAGLIRHRREERALEYKGTRGQEPFAWGPDAVNAKIARTCMAMANIGGGAIVIGMDQVGPDEWEPNGVEESIATSYQQDRVQRYVNQRADPFVELTVYHHHQDGRHFVIIDVAGVR